VSAQLIDDEPGYLEDWRYNATLSGAPQGGVASPILSNIYLDRLDRFVEQQLLPVYNRGRRRRPNPAYQAVDDAIARAKRRGDREAVRALRRQRRRLPSQDPNDPDYRRLRYVRYADLCRVQHKSALGYPFKRSSLGRWIVLAPVCTIPGR
jgi:retron-type reverse transcriptase